MNPDPLAIQNPPNIPGLTFRGFRGERDYPAMLAVLLASEKADQVERADTLEDLARSYARLKNCDPLQDILFAEVNGKMIGYVRVWWWDDAGYGRIYDLGGFLVPEWRRLGVGSTLLGWAENRLRIIAVAHPPGQKRFFEVVFSQHQVGGIAMAERAGYEPFRFWNNLVRPSLEDIPNYPLPAGIEVRPARPEHYRDLG